MGAQPMRVAACARAGGQGILYIDIIIVIVIIIIMIMIINKLSSCIYGDARIQSVISMSRVSSGKDRFYNEKKTNLPNRTPREVYG
jgi:hypothetical protein